MLQNTEPYPRFGVQDFIEKVDGPCPVVPGMWFVRPTGYLGGPSKEMQKRPPLRGECWITTLALKWLLDHKIIRWADVFFKCVASFPSLPTCSLRLLRDSTLSAPM